MNLKEVLINMCYKNAGELETQMSRLNNSSVSTQQVSRPTCVTRSLVHDVITLLIIFLRFKIGPNKFHNRL